jgi:autotransporter-associated beta strand protein
MAFITLGAIVGTVLLTAAPGTASPRPKNLIVRVLDFILPGKEKQESSLKTPVPKTAKQAWTPSDPAGGVSHEVAAASRTVTTATVNGIRTDFGKIADRSAGINTTTFPRIETGTKTQSANTRSGGTTSSGESLLSASGSTANGGVSTEGTTTATVIDPDGTWTANASGNWSDTTKWLGGIVADGGGFANFSTVNLTGARTVTIDTTSRTVRRLDIGDTNSSHSYTIAASGGGSLIFDNTANSANAQLNEVLNSNGDTISAPIVLNSSLDIANASANALTLSGGITAGTAGTKTITTSTGAVTISGVIGDGSGTVALTQNGTGTLTLSGTAANTFTGLTNIQMGEIDLDKTAGIDALAGDVQVGGTGAVLQLLNSNQIKDTANMTVNTGGTFNLNNKSETINALNGNGGTVTGSGAATLTVGSAGGSGSYAGVITGGMSFAKSGSGTETLTGNNTYTGATTINGGTLEINNNNSASSGRLSGTSVITVNSGGTLLLSGSSSWTDRINDNADMTLNGGTFNTGGLSEHGATNNTAGIGKLTLQSSSIIDMGSGSSIIAFAKSAGNPWSGTLSIYNWSGTPVTGGGTDQLYFSANGDGLKAPQLADIQFYSGFGTGAYAPGAIILSDGEVVPTGIPEPSTWIGGALALGALGYTQRRRLARCAKHLPVAAAVPAAISAMRLRICSRAGSRSSLPFCRRHACHYSAPAVAFLLLVPIGNAKTVGLNEAKVTQVIQDVRLLESNASPRPASTNDTVREGTAVRTGTESRAELTFTDQTLTRLGANTVFNFGAEPRTVDLGSGAVLIYVPKNAGGAKIRAGTVTGAITGTTVTVEYDPRPPGFIKYTVLEGSMCIRLNGQAVPIFAGQQLIFSPDATSLPQPVSVDLKRLLEISPLTTGSPRPLPSAALIAGEAQHQRETRAIIDQLVHAVTLAGAPNVKDASAATFISAFSSVIIRAKNEEVCVYAIAAATLRPDLIGEILVATRKSREGEPRFTCECIERIIRAAIAADSKAAGTIVNAALYAEPDARDCIGQADPCQQGTSNLVVPAQVPSIDPANLISDPAVVSPER